MGFRTSEDSSKSWTIQDAPAGSSGGLTVTTSGGACGAAAKARSRSHGSTGTLRRYTTPHEPRRCRREVPPLLQSPSLSDDVTVFREDEEDAVRIVSGMLRRGEGG